MPMQAPRQMMVPGIGCDDDLRPGYEPSGRYGLAELLEEALVDVVHGSRLDAELEAFH
jgi:hypothetical protein